MRYLYGADGLALVEYIGDEAMVEFVGIVTGAHYVFGVNRRRCYVDVHDLGDKRECIGKLYAEQEDGRYIFEVDDASVF